MKDAKAPTVLILAVLAGGCKDGSSVKASRPHLIREELSVEIDELVSKATAVNVENRFSSARELQEALEALSS